MTDMSEDYNKFAKIPPFAVKIDPSIVLNKKRCSMVTMEKNTWTLDGDIGDL